MLLISVRRLPPRRPGPNEPMPAKNERLNGGLSV